MARNPELTRQLIVDKALTIFNTKGYNAASLSDITSISGMTKGAIYGNFKNKDELATAAFEHGVEMVKCEIAKRVRAEATAPDKLRAIVRFYEEYIEKPPIIGGCPIFNSSIEADDSLPFLRSRVIRSIALLKDSLTKIVNRGIVEGQIKKGVDAEEFANFFYSIITGATSLSRIEGDSRSYKFVKKFVERQVEEISA